MSSETDLQQVLPAWLELASKTDVSLGLDPSEAFQRAERLLNDLRSGTASTDGWTPEAERVEVLHALVALIIREEDEPKAALRNIELAFDFISNLRWSAEQFGGPRQLMATCAFQAWRMARRFAPYAEVQNLASRLLAASEARIRAEQLFSIPAAQRETVGFADPEFALCVCETLRSRLETAPPKVREVADFSYSFVEKLSPAFGQDERDYFLGEFALMAGAASRFLARTDDAENWFRRAEAHFALIQNAHVHCARVAYQRLALLVEKRHLQEVLDQSSPLADTFTRLGMSEDALKCRFLEGNVYLELGRNDRGIDVFRRICAEADAMGSKRLLAQSTNNLVRCYVNLGDVENALLQAGKALPIQKELDDRVGLLKLRWSIADLLRGQGKHSAALGAFREGLREAREIGLRGDLAAIHLVIADLLLEAGQEAQAELEIREALPIIEEEKMVSEGIAALSLLRESLLRRQIDHGALRDLHRHLEDRPR